MAEKLENRFSEAMDFLKQGLNDREYLGYYVANAFRVLTGKEPSHISSRNMLVKSYLYSAGR
jgi:hypothetical protein